MTNPMSSATDSHAGVHVRDFEQGKWCPLERLVRKLFKSQFRKCLSAVCLKVKLRISWRGDQEPTAESTTTALGAASGQQPVTRSPFGVHSCTQNTLPYKVGIVVLLCG